jgi:hypothetical protein
MAQTGYTPIQLYRTATASAAPTSGNLADGELAINTLDGKLFYKDSSGVVQTIATKGTGPIGGSNTYVQYNNNGALGGSSSFVFDGTNVGIGTSSPATRLDVQSSSAGTATGLVKLYATNGSDRYAGIDFHAVTSETYNKLAQITAQTTNGGTGSGAAIGGDLIFRTNNSASNVPTERMRIDANGNVGIGTSTFNGVKTVVQGAQTGGAPQTSGTTQTYGLLRLKGTTFTSALDFGTNGGNYNWIQATDSANLATNYDLAIQPNGGNVGIGTTSPGALLHVGTTTAKIRIGATAGSEYLDISRDSATGNMIYNAAQTAFGTHNFQIAGAEAMRIDSSGNLLVGTTNTNPIGGNVSGVTVSPVGFLNVQRSAGTAGSMAIGNNTIGTLMTFYYTGGGSAVNVGQIVITTTTSSFVGTSDYRLKEDIAPLASGISTIAALKPISYKWKLDQSVGEGFIAHELGEVIPLALFGEKDAVNENGSIKPQGIDMTKIVPHLVAAIQELSAKVTALESR